MREMETTLTQKGQVTIPVEIRTRLGLRPKDRVRFEVEGEAVVIRPAGSRIARHFGAVRAPAGVADARAERLAFEEGVAEEVAAKDL